MSEHPYQITPQVVQLQAERANAVAYGNETRVEAIDKQLAGLGVKAKAAQERKAVAEESDEVDDGHKKPPQGRSSRPQQTTR